MLRGGAGVFGAARQGGKTHTGVDVVANQSSTDKNTYRVVAVAGGIVAYAKVNGENPGEGYGYTVIVDHQDGTYTLYAHFAIVASAGIVKVGDVVTAGQLLGYMADLANGEMSSGNVIANSVPTYDKIQLHFEEFQATSGRSSTDAIAPIKQGAIILDPTSDLKNHGYQ
jgi:murein DD-endopeptidase MepM/ murein hydrolase activator NlpD